MVKKKIFLKENKKTTNKLTSRSWRANMVNDVKIMAWKHGY